MDGDRAYDEYRDLLDRETIEGPEPPWPSDPVAELDDLDADRMTAEDKAFEEATDVPSGFLLGDSEKPDWTEDPQ